MKKIKVLTLIGIIVLFMTSFNTIAQEAWIVPNTYEKMVNPMHKTDWNSVGKILYMKHCKSCHGKEGYGDGPKADGLDGNLGDFSSEEYQSQSDGALYYKTTFGRDDMPAYDKKIPDDEDRWIIVNYMRTLK